MLDVDMGVSLDSSLEIVVSLISLELASDEAEIEDEGSCDDSTDDVVVGLAQADKIRADANGRMDLDLFVMML